MKTNMYDYICETPDVLTYIINNRKTILLLWSDRYENHEKEHRTFLMRFHVTFFHGVGAGGDGLSHVRRL